MNNQREIYEALLGGKTLIHVDGIKVVLEDTFPITWTFKHPQDWSIYKDTFEMKPASWVITNRGEVLNSDRDVSTSQKFGMAFHTKEHVERAREEMREANLLRYWASVVDPTWRADWDNEEQEKWFIELYNNEYRTEDTDVFKAIGTVYMSEETATKICEALNNGGLTL
jgi:hypothetical protein